MPELVGGLALDSSGVIHFQYAASWIAREVELAPFQLPSSIGMRVTPAPDKRKLHGLHGVFADCLPDRWGMQIIERALLKSGIRGDQLGTFERLAYLGDETMGALTFQPPIDGISPTSNETISLDDLAIEALAVYEGSPIGAIPRLTEGIGALERAGGSAGGAQPKVLIAQAQSGGPIFAGANPPAGATPYLLKFSPKRDGLGLRASGGVLEEAYAQMARAAGIKMPMTRLFATTDTRLHFAVERFDRTITRGRRHVLTFGGLIGKEAGDGGDYDTLIRYARSLTRDERTVEEIVRRLIFNLSVLNDDDHIKNISFLLEPESGWTLAPAYDLTYSPSRYGERGMSVDGRELDTKWTTIQSLAERNSITPARLDGLRSEVNQAVGRWAEFADSAHVSDAEREEVQTAISGRRALLEG